MDKTPATPTIPVDRFRANFRELSLSVFEVFRYGGLSRTILDSESNTREQTELHLLPPQLIFLLQDLCTKLTKGLANFGGLRVGVALWVWPLRFPPPPL